MKKILLILAVFFAFVGHAQLSDLHYLPPMKQGQNKQAIDRQAIYLSTPEPTTFTVNAYRGTNTTVIATFNISNVSPAVYTLGNGDNNITLVTNANTGIVLSNSGLRFESPSNNKFYVNYRGSSNAQSASLTSKGRVAMGTSFKWGGVPNLGKHPSKSNTLGIMATENNTTVTLSGYDPDCEFRLGNNVAGITADTYTVTLNANESFVFENYVGNSPTVANSQGWIGASIISDKDIVISNGSMNFGRQTGASNRDAGIDQPVPENRLGKEYVFVRGNGNANGWTEFPLLIAVADNTQIFINGSITATATLNNGDYFEVPSSFYSSTTVGANMLIETSKDVYAYQCMAGASTAYTQGLNFVAPVNCLLPDVMDNIPDIRNMAGTNVTGGLTIIAAVNTPDENIVVSNDASTIPLPASVPVAGSSDWKTFFIPNLSGNISVQSTGPMAVGFFGYSGARGVAGYFSGFDTVPVVNLEIRGGGGCLPNADILEVTGNFDAYEWYEDGVLIPGENGPSFQPSKAGDFYCSGTKGPCTYDSQTISAYYCDSDVVINKSIDKPEIIEGETATFSLEVKNFSTVPLTNLQITDNLPSGLTFVSASTTTGTWSGSTWNIGTLDGGGTAVLLLTVRGDEIDTLPLIGLINTITHTQDQVDINITEDTPSARITIHNDYDNDGVIDITDVDDDNDGIYDDDECFVDICFEPIVNESFENPIIPNNSYRILHESAIEGWSTTATDGRIELWSDGFLGVPAFDGNQFAELNANQNSALYQNLCLTPGTVMAWSLRHRGRAGVDVMRVRIGADLASATVQATMSDDNDAWGYYSGFYTVPAGQVNTTFIFEAVSTANGSLSVGNLIDDIQVTIADVPVCSDTNNDGIPDNLDLDSDGDGCSDANEYYKDLNADGGDGGEYASGPPAVNPDGSVIAASYIKVFAPEIILGNTSEDLGGSDINGQDVSLGQTLEYVLRFQNTGDDNATNYTIRNILPDNVTYNSVDISNAPNVIPSFDLPSQTLTLTIPNDLVEVGDPEYSVRIEVTIALNCSDFVAACSSSLENNAFSTYQGVLNNGTFTDENGSNSISGCPQTRNIANNSIFNDLSNCNQARTVQLCGDNVILAAGSGFTTYNWVLDANGNGQVDGSETSINDGDPDNDPSTLLVTTVGDYIVEKSSNGSCPNLAEQIKVEGFGSTQTNPIEDYFNQVNTDNNPDNDLQGEIVTCSIDGDNLTKIFLCGVDDEATIQLGITDAQSIVWQKLNANSCSSTGDDCANKNGTCTWSTGVTQDNFTVSESGEYRVVINYQNGCFSRFYFNVFKNELDVTYTAEDIVCTTDGSIRITNVGSGYGFQLVDAINGNIIVPFSANNGPDFNIVNNGTYKVQVTQLDPSTGEPIGAGGETCSNDCAPVDALDILGSLKDFAFFTSIGAVSNTSTSSIVGDIGTNNGAISGFGTSTHTSNDGTPGTLFTEDAVTAQAVIDVDNAYNSLMALPNTETAHTPAFGSGETLNSGVYSIAAAGSLAGAITLDGQNNPDAIFVFKFAGAFTVAAQSKVILTNGTKRCNVFWLGGAGVTTGAISIGADAKLKGTFLSHGGACTSGANTSIEGKMLSTGGAIGFSTGVIYNDTLCFSGNCLFETADIGIQELDFQVNITTTPADCNQLGTISIQVLNVVPNYSYELRLDDGSNGGLGSLVSSQPALNNDTHVFSNVNPNNYIVVTRTDDGCLDSQQIVVNDTPDVRLIATNSQNITCASGIATLTPSGGAPNTTYQMAIWSKDGVDLYANPSDIPAADLQSTPNVLFRDSTDAGDYEFVVIDSNGCFAVSNSITIEDLGNPVITASNTTITCADSGTANLTVNVTGGTAPYRYSLDGGVNYQTTDTFYNLAAGFFTITVMDSSDNGGVGCVETLDYEVTQPFRLTASPSIIEDAFCDPNGALVKILNPNGGQAPYEFSFDGGSTFGFTDELRLLSGSYQLVLRDNLGCTYDMDITVPNPIAEPSFSQAVDYDCTGTGTITMTPSNTSDFNYTYSLNGTLNAPVDNNTFTNVAVGTQTITVGYTGSIAPNQSTLFFENFGTGPNTQIGEVGPGYCYEPQDGSTTSCNLGPAGILVDGEYSVTNNVTNPIPAYRNPNDHSALADGRFLAINPSNNLVGTNSIVWNRTTIEVLPNRDIDISFWAYNLRQTGSVGNNPEILIELVDTSGNVLSSFATNEIPKNNNANDWHARAATLNPGANTVISIVLRSSQLSDDGNELILDDIQASQAPEICEKTTDITVLVETGQAFVASLLSTIDPSCSTSADGAIRFEVANFDTTTGFEYSTDSGATWTTSLVSPVTTPATFAAAVYTIEVRKAADNSCITDFQATVTAPAPIVPQLTQIADYTCFNTGGTLEASATGGSPIYEYRLEDVGGAEIAAYQTNPRFTNIPDGDYLVRVRDTNGCEALLPLSDAVTIDPPATITFDVAPVACYDGQNNASITILVTAGNGGYTFRISGGAWMTPTPATATDYTFTGLSNGSYDIEVTDSFGCVSPVETVLISPILLAQIDVVDASSCGDGSITATPSGGLGSYVYAFLPTGTAVQDSDFAAANSFSVTNATIGDFDVYVRDNSSTDPYCQFLETRTVASSPVLAFTALPTDAVCFGDDGSIDVNITSGLAPYTYQLVDIDHSTSDATQTGVMSTSKTYFNLTPGAYNVIITDAAGCSVTVNGATIDEPIELTADLESILSDDCAPATGFRFTNYPTTLNGSLQFSYDGGSTWQTSDTFDAPTYTLTSGNAVDPSIRTVDASNNELCRINLPQYIINFPLDDLDISISTVIKNCTELEVTVQGNEGTAPYQYTYTDNPATFNAVTPANPWSTPAKGLSDPEVFAGLIPGRTYVFYVKDANGCIRQSEQNVAELQTNPIDIDAVFQPACSTLDNGQITYTLIDNIAPTELHMRWELYNLSGNIILSSGNGTTSSLAGNIVNYASTINIIDLAPDEYYIVVSEVNSGIDTCISASENLLLEELDPITATLNPFQHISCENPGLILVENIQGGGGTYNYNVSGPGSFTLTGTTDNPIEIPANSLAGLYNVHVRDQYGCSYDLGDVTMNLSANPTINTVVIDNCSAAASVTISATTGAASMVYSLDNGTTYVNNGGIFNNVTPGSYTVFVKDGHGCTDSRAITVNPNLQATASLTQNLGCGTGQEAELTLSISAGSGNYEYEITNTSGTVISRQNMATVSIATLVTTADTYTINIYDVGTSSPECSRSFTVIVPPAVQPSFTAIPTDVTCNNGSDGTIAITENNNGNNPLTYSLVPNNGSFNAATSTYVNLPIGTYSITATAPNGCTTTLNNITVNEPNPITFDLPTVTPFVCSTGNTQDNATITIDLSSIAGGSGVYTRYQFVENGSGTVVQNGTNSSYIFTDIAGGDVMVRAYDENGCVGEQLVNVPAYDALETPTITVDDTISCSNLGEGISIDITSTITNYTSHPGNYEFRMLPTGAFQASNEFPNLQPGSYTFTIRNIATSCEITATHSVADPNTFDITVDKVTDAICFGDDGSITLTMTDATYTGGFTWQIFNSNGTPADRSDDGPAIMNGSSANMGPTASIPVPSGTYIVEVIQDAFPDCSQVRSFSITTPPAALTLDTIERTDAGCSNDRGSASIQPLGGLAPYDIQLTNTITSTVSNATGVNANLFQNLTAGEYSISVTDALGCTETFVNAFELLLPDAINGSISQTTLECQGDTDASLSLALSPRNVSSSYRYILNSYSDVTGGTLLRSTASQVGDTFPNLDAGFYTIEVLDTMGCTFESVITEIVEPIDVNAQLLTTQSIGCLQGATLVLTAEGGTAPYTWSADGSTFNPMNGSNGPDTHEFLSVVAGTYQYYVQDSFNCLSTISNEVGVSTIEDLSVTLNTSAAVINCNGENTASIDAVADGGLGNYQYGLFADASLTNELRPYQTNGLFDNLTEGTYYVSVLSNDCQVTSEVLTITEPEVLVVIPTITDVLCNGDDNGSIVISMEGGTSPYQYAISPNLNQFDEVNSFENLAPGDYSVIVQDSKGCFELIEFTITEPDILEMEVTVTPEYCVGEADGVITIAPTGGTAPYSTSLNSNSSADYTEDLFTYANLTSGDYIVFVKDANGCETNQTVIVAEGVNINATVEVIYDCPDGALGNSIQVTLEDKTERLYLLFALDSTDPNDLQLEPDFTNITPGSHMLTIAHDNGCTRTFLFEVEAFEPLRISLEQQSLNEITVIGAGGREGYTFLFNGVDNGDDNTFYIRETGNYEVTVLDENGCAATANIFMEFIDIEIPNFFTPNGDGQNDIWLPGNIEQFPELFLNIYDRYGRLVFRLKNSPEGWDGFYQDNTLPTGDYWYVIKLNGEDDTREFVGNFTLYR
ncbi:ice-binding family protein [Maribacter antarcticus]|uniref:ice-binding family protein n=1 Tax=Maribacter antarcticus TaxID=505250 RepID=UPI00068909B7|nr:ice-binding family protein [Maribacter antarcticus]